MYVDFVEDSSPVDDTFFLDNKKPKKTKRKDAEGSLDQAKSRREERTRESVSRQRIDIGNEE